MAQTQHEDELYLCESRSDKRLFSSDILFRTPRRRRSATESESESADHQNFIYFCAAVQALELDFLPITWQPHAGLIGRGGTSEIRQSLLSLEVSLAFKAIHVRDDLRTRTDEGLESIFSLLMAEIQHMGMKAIRNSAYIHKVEGICWSVNRDTGVVDPILVYEKARYGDMDYFVTSGQGKSLDLLGRVKLCRDVAVGLETLHCCSRSCTALRSETSILTVGSGIVHGDVKPENVLMMDFDGVAVPQVADFGYSATYTSIELTVVVSRTAPWHAPEVGRRMDGYLPIEAIRTDIFSFGMMCLWVLFGCDVVNHYGITRDFANNHKCGEDAHDPSFKIINQLKEQDELRSFCRDQIQSLDLEPGQSEHLTKLFEMTLSPNATDRASSLQQILEHLNSFLRSKLGDQAEPMVYNVAEDVALRQHYDFEVKLLPTTPSVHT